MPPESPPTPVRERILQAALATLRQDGLRGFTQVAVARRARVRQSHLTYYFPTRHDLLEATVLRFAEAVGHGLGRTVRESPRRARGAVLAHLVEAVAEPGHMRMFLGVVVEAGEDPALRALIARGTERLEVALAGALGGKRPAVGARAALATAWGLGLYRYTLRPPPERDPTGPALAALERGLSRRTDAAPAARKERRS